MRQAIPAAMRLAVTLHYLAEGCSLSSIRYHWRLGKSTASQIVYSTCEAIWNELVSEFMNPPSSINDWKTISAR